jgi:hypothetical protein
MTKREKLKISKGVFMKNLVLSRTRHTLSDIRSYIEEIEAKFSQDIKDLRKRYH